ncbi:hypothetical protein [Ligilactobacillus animalis]|uniref:hypothetical protein n=1 Tax=Ligilactobacillus animalis TaxID=1605 RepID=UPI0010A4C739|nr:hypothetical protein [Ligilactobacillus animalis]
MLSQSDETIAAWKATERTLAVIVDVNDTKYTATDINSLKYDAGAYTGETFAIGSTYSNNVQIEFSHLVEGLKLGDIVEVSIGIKVSNKYIYDPLGVFIISSEIKMDRNNNLTTISASDAFCKLEGMYKSKLIYPAKALDVISEICAMSGVDPNTSELSRLPKVADIPTAVESQSYRKTLGWIAQLYAGYATFDRSGKLTIRTVAEPSYELDPSQYEQGGLTKNEATYKIGGIQCQVTTKSTTRDDQAQETTTTLQAGSTSGAQIKLENNIMTQARLDDVWQKLKDINFYPFSLNWFGNPAVEAGDWLRLYDKKGNDFIVPNNGYTLEFNGGLSAVSKADQTSGSSQVVNWSGGVMQTIRELQHRNSPDGTVIFPTSVTEPPKNAHFNDVWFKRNGNSTELWIFERQTDGTGKWQRKDVANDAVKKQVEDQQKDLISVTNKANEAFNTASAANSNANSLYQKMTELRATFDTTISDTEAKLKAQAKEEAKKALDKAQKLSDDYTTSMTNVNAELLALNSAKDKANADINKLVTDVNGVRGLYNNLDGRITQFSAGVDGLSAQLTDTKKQLASVKLTADGANAKFANQQNEIASLKVKAGTIEQQMLAKVDNNLFESFKSSTAKELKEKLTATDLNGYVKTAELTRTADGLRTSVTAVEDKINNLNLGGRNYLQGTADFTWPTGIGDWNSPKKTIEQYNSDLKMLHVSNSILGGIYTRWADAFPNGELQIGENYTFSFDAKGTGTFLAVGNESGNQATKTSVVGTALTPSWKRYSVSGTITALNKAFVIYFKDNYDVYIKCVKIEKGNKSTDWTPAPEDANKQFSAVNNTLRTYRTDLDILKDGMSVRVSEIAQVNSKINNLTIGGTNLLSNTSTEIRSNDAPTSAWVEGAVYNTNNPLTESKYVLSFEARGDVDRQIIGTFLWSGGLGGGNIARSSVSSDGHTSTAEDGRTFVTLSTSWKKYWVKYEVTPDNTRKSAIVGRRWLNSKPSGKVYIRKVKLETGDKATDYSPAPEDLESKYASLNVKVDGINSTVTNKADMSYVEQKANEINIAVSTKAEKSYVEQKANEIKTTVSAKADMSYVTQKVNEINSVVANKADSSFVIQKANEINNVVKNKSDISYVNQKVSEINTTVANKADISLVTQTANIWQAKLEGLRIGGTNLLANTSQEQHRVISPTGNATYSEGAVYVTTQPLNDTKYTLSFEARSDYANQYIESYFYNHGLGGSNGVTKSVDSNGETKVVTKGDGNFKVKLTSGWKRYWITYDFVPDNTKKGVIVGRRFKTSNPLGSTYVKNVKLEVGDKPTDWSPAPEDSTVAISAVRTDLTNAINLRVSKGDVLSQLNIEAGRTLIQTKKLYLDADTVAFSGKAFIPSAAIASLSADKINGGTINGRTVNVTNLNANNITSGTINGQNLSMNLDTGVVDFQKGRIRSTTGTLDIDIDRGTLQISNNSGEGIFASYGRLEFSSKTNWGGNLPPQYGKIYRTVDFLTGVAEGITIEGSEGVEIKTSNYNGWGTPTLSGTPNGVGLTMANNGKVIFESGGPLRLIAGDSNNITRPSISIGTNTWTDRGSDNERGQNVSIVGNGVYICPTGETMIGDGGLIVEGRLGVRGAKNSIVDTSQGKTAINAYETAEYYFGDIAKTNTGASKRVKIMIDPIFLETINTDINYHVFVSSYDNGYAWVSEMAKDYFVIESNVPNLHVSYEIKAKRKQYENVRLDKVDMNLTGGKN